MKRWKAILGIAGILVLAVLTVLVVRYFTSPSGVPEIVLPTAPSGGDPALETEGVDSAPGDVTPETVQAVISTLTRADSYSRAINITRYWTGGSGLSKVTAHSRGQQLKVIIETDGHAAKNILISDGYLWIWYDNDFGTRAHVSPASDDARKEADEYMGLLTYEDILGIDPEIILDAGFVYFEGDACVYVRYESGNFGYETEAYISVDTGLLTAEYTWDGDTLVFKAESEYTELTTPEDVLFVPPEALPTEETLRP